MKWLYHATEAPKLVEDNVHIDGWSDSPKKVGPAKPKPDAPSPGVVAGPPHDRTHMTSPRVEPYKAPQPYKAPEPHKAPEHVTEPPKAEPNYQRGPKKY